MNEELERVWNILVAAMPYLKALFQIREQRKNRIADFWAGV
jgi:hypothetical protein